MLSRVADSIYWMNRYIERADNVARFIDVNWRLILDTETDDSDQWQPLVATSGDQAKFFERYGHATRANVVRFLTFDMENPNSIRSCVRFARENARSVREVISSEMWEQINSFYLMMNEAAIAENAGHQRSHDFYERVKEASHLFGGMTDSTMSHGEGWHFGRLGRMLERADKTSRILDVKYFGINASDEENEEEEAKEEDAAFDEIEWSAVLKSASALEMYRKRFRRIMPSKAIDFLLLDREFPRAVLHCLLKSQASLHAISGTPIGSFRNTAEQRLGQLLAELAYAHVEEILEGGLHDFFDAFQTRLNYTGEGIYETFFRIEPVEAKPAPAPAPVAAPVPAKAAEPEKEPVPVA